MVVQENAPGLTRNLSTENEPDDTSSVNVNMATSGDGPDTDISEAIVLSPATSMNILSRAVSGEGGGNTDGGASTPPSLHGSNVGGDDGVNAEVPEGDPAPADDKEDMFGYSKVFLITLICFGFFADPVACPGRSCGIFRTVYPTDESSCGRLLPGQ